MRLRTGRAQSVTARQFGINRGAHVGDPRKRRCRRGVFNRAQSRRGCRECIGKRWERRRGVAVRRRRRRHRFTWKRYATRGAGRVCDRVSDAIERNGRHAAASGNVSAVNRFNGPNVGAFGRVKCCRIGRVAGFQNHNGAHAVRPYVIGCSVDRNANARGGCIATIGRGRVADRSGARGRFKRDAIARFSAHNVRDPRERHNVRAGNGGRVRGGCERRESEHD